MCFSVFCADIPNSTFKIAHTSSENCLEKINNLLTMQASQTDCHIKLRCSSFRDSASVWQFQKTTNGYLIRNLKQQEDYPKTHAGYLSASNIQTQKRLFAQITQPDFLKNHNKLNQPGQILQSHLFFEIYKTQSNGYYLKNKTLGQYLTKDIKTNCVFFSPSHADVWSLIAVEYIPKRLSKSKDSVCITHQNLIDDEEEFEDYDGYFDPFDILVDQFLQDQFLHSFKIRIQT